MGREVGIYQLVKSNQLYALLTKTADAGKSFETFVAERKAAYGASYQVDYGKLVDKAKTDVNEVAPNELFELVYWIEEEMGLENDEAIDRIFKATGIEQLYKSSTKSEANALIIQYYNYSEAYELEQEKEQKDDAGVKIEIENFLLFLDYLILLLQRISKLNKETPQIHYLDAEEEKINKIKQIRKSDNKLKGLLAREERWIQKIVNENKDSEKRLPPEGDLIYRIEKLTAICLVMRRKIEEKEGYIIILDSV